MVTSSIPIGEWSGSDATNRLRVAIEEHQKESARATTTMVRLTRTMLALTIVTTIATIVQVWLAFRPLT
jgi:hypothetical protein